ncbi:MAG TPA: M18 family aminopeptidase [Candidatus Eisenbacteria bacterium]|nr:M18 family aminopeptidase [Candidatus Eisenbacteria bacterium]
MDKYTVAANELLDFIKKSPTAYQAVANIKQALLACGFKVYQPNQKPNLKKGDRYFYTKNDSAILAFEIGNNPIKNGLRIFGAHTDSPSLRIKPNSISVKDNVIRLNTEIYGGPILNTWFDRPLSLAGRVTIKNDQSFEPKTKLIDFKKPILVLPNLAIHMNREVNKGVEIKANQHLLPFIALTDEKEIKQDWFNELIAKKLDIKADDILDFDLFIYEASPGEIVGIKNEFILAPRLDNLAMCQAGIKSLLSLSEKREFNGINILLYTDNEEVGSMTKQGANSLFLRDIIESICLNLGASRQDFLAIFDHSIMISADQAHAVHPNYSEFSDPDHRPMINGGPVIKLAASQSYASDSKSAGYFMQLCEKANVPYQWFVNRSDLRGGSTIGSITASRLPMSTVDIGNAIWAMHSSRETGGVKDIYYLEKVLKVFFNI